MSAENNIFQLVETSLSALCIFLMYRIAVLALNNKKTSQ